MISSTQHPEQSPAEHHLLRAPQLDKLGVRPLNRWDLELECKNCFERWTPARDPDGRLKPGYWQCPNRCNW